MRALGEAASCASAFDTKVRARSMLVPVATAAILALNASAVAARPADTRWDGASSTQGKQRAHARDDADVSDRGRGAAAPRCGPRARKAFAGGKRREGSTHGAIVTARAHLDGRARTQAPPASATSSPAPPSLRPGPTSSRCSSAASSRRTRWCPTRRRPSPIPDCRPARPPLPNPRRHAAEARTAARSPWRWPASAATSSHPSRRWSKERGRSAAAHAIRSRTGSSPASAPPSRRPAPDPASAPSLSGGGSIRWVASAACLTPRLRAVLGTGCRQLRPADRQLHLPQPQPQPTRRRSAALLPPHGQRGGFPCARQLRGGARLPRPTAHRRRPQALRRRRVPHRYRPAADVGLAPPLRGAPIDRPRRARRTPAMAASQSGR